MTSKPRCFLLKSLCAAALGSLLVAAPAPAHMIDSGRAADTARAAAEKLGEVDHVDCWRPRVRGRPARHAAVCVAWWVRTAAGESCTLFYEVRLARHPSPRLRVIESFDPWCA
jgi:hypothetical protein